MRTPSLAVSEMLLTHDVIVKPLSKLSLVVTSDRTSMERNLLAGALYQGLTGSEEAVNYSQLCKEMVITRGRYSTGERQGKARGDQDQSNLGSKAEGSTCRQKAESEDWPISISPLPMPLKIQF